MKAPSEKHLKAREEQCDSKGPARTNACNLIFENVIVFTHINFYCGFMNIKFRNKQQHRSVIIIITYRSYGRPVSSVVPHVRRRGSRDSSTGE